MATVTTTRLRRPGMRQASLLDAAPMAPGHAVAARPAQRETLEDRIVSTWGALSISHTASCPLCGGELVPRYSAGARPVGGRCRTCATELS